MAKPKAADKLATRAAGCWLRGDQAGYRKAWRQLCCRATENKARSLIDAEKSRLKGLQQQTGALV